MDTPCFFSRASSSLLDAPHPCPSCAKNNTTPCQDKGVNVNDVLSEVNALMERVSGKPLPASMLSTIDDLEELGYVCDESGCVLVLPSMDEESDGAFSGSRWRARGAPKPPFSVGRGSSNREGAPRVFRERGPAGVSLLSLSDA